MSRISFKKNEIPGVYPWISLHPVKMWTLSETSRVMLFQVPDSAGTATALFTGVKTRMAVLGIDGTPNFNSCDPEILEKSKLKSLLHRAVEDGKATGLLEAFSLPSTHS